VGFNVAGSFHPSAGAGVRVTLRCMNPSPRDRLSWRLDDSDPLFDFNVRSLGMSGPYGVTAVGITCAAITAGAATVDVPTLHGRIPAPKVRILGPDSGASQTHLPIEAVQRNYAGGTASANPAWLNLQPVTATSSAFLELSTPEPPTFFVK
jgi:hypothetical protein